MSIDVNNGYFSSTFEICYDEKGDRVKHGQQYIPLDKDACTKCICMHGKAEMCISILCSPPENCRKYHKVVNKCCQFVCLDGGISISLEDAIPIKSTHNSHSKPSSPLFNKTFPIKDKFEKFNSISTIDLGLRAIISAITSFLILALLLYIINRYRKRNFILMLRRFQNCPAEHLNYHNQNCHANSLDGMSNQISYDNYDCLCSNRQIFPFNCVNFDLEPPPPYLFWKTAFEQQLHRFHNHSQAISSNNFLTQTSSASLQSIEAPPSYEETIINGNNNKNTATKIPYCSNHWQLQPILEMRQSSLLSSGQRNQNESTNLAATITHHGSPDPSRIVSMSTFPNDGTCDLLRYSEPNKIQHTLVKRISESPPKINNSCINELSNNDDNIFNNYSMNNKDSHFSIKNYSEFIASLHMNKKKSKSVIRNKNQLQLSDSNHSLKPLSSANNVGCHRFIDGSDLNFSSTSSSADCCCSTSGLSSISSSSSSSSQLSSLVIMKVETKI